MPPSPKKSDIPQTEIELLQLELKELQDTVKSLSSTLNSVVDGQGILSQELSTVKEGTTLKLPKELTTKIDPSQVFLYALQAVVGVVVSRQASPTALKKNIATHADFCLDLATSVLTQFIARNSLP